MDELAGSATSATPKSDPRAPLGHLSRLGFALVGARTVDEIASCVLTDLVSLPGVRRVGIALSEGGGRRLRFLASDRELDGPLPWCHIDAYDDVPLTTVVRTGTPIMAGLDDFGGQYSALVARQRKDATAALAAIPLPGTGSPIGGLILFFDTPQPFDEAQWRLLDASARRTAEALRRVRAANGRDEIVLGPGGEVPEGVLTARTLLDNDPRAAGTARRFVRQHLGEWEFDDDLADTAQLCLSELVTNAVIHADSPSELRVSLEAGVLTVIVRDQGGPGPTDQAHPTDDADPLRVHGRGLMLVDALSSRWGSERDAKGTTVWFALEPDQDQGSSARTG